MLKIMIRSTQKFKEELDGEFDAYKHDWQSQSPDINPIENFLAWIK